MKASAVLLLLAIPLASANDFGHARDQSWNPRGPGVPDLWVPHDLVQGETAVLSFIEFPSAEARLVVTDPEQTVVFAENATLTSQGSGYYGTVLWPIPRDLPAGNYAVEGMGPSGEGVVVSAILWKGPHLFPGTAPTVPGDRLYLEAVGFDATPATGIVVQGAHRWEVAWPDAKGQPRTIEDNGVATVPGADAPRRVVGGSDGHESVILSPRALEAGAAWINGTFGGEPRSLHVAWTLPPSNGAPLLLAEENAVANDTVEIIGHGWGASVRLTLGNATRDLTTSSGFFEALLPTADRPGVAMLTATDGIREITRAVEIHPRPTTSGHGPSDIAPLPIPFGGVVLALLTIVVSAQLRKKRIIS